MSDKNSLKIVDHLGKINPYGYYRVVENIITKDQELSDFSGSDSQYTAERTKQLLTAIATKTPSEPESGVEVPYLNQLDGTDNPENVTDQNCTIRANIDVRRPVANSYSKVTIPLPEEALGDTNFGYIDDYIVEFLKLYGKADTLSLPNTGDEDSRQIARKYMFGVMMLTKCR